MLLVFCTRLASQYVVVYRLVSVTCINYTNIVLSSVVVCGDVFIVIIDPVFLINKIMFVLSNFCCVYILTFI